MFGNIIERMGWLFMISLLYGSALSAQDWQSIQADTFCVDADGKMLLESHKQFGGIIKDYKDIPFPSKFWMLGDLWHLQSPRESEAYFVFGYKDGGQLKLWTAGYSLQQQKILLGALRVEQEGRIDFLPLAHKSVEILNLKNKYVYKIIFLSAENQLKIEVNGVPLLTDAPFPVSSITFLGYLVRGGAVRFDMLRIDGE